MNGTGWTSILGAGVLMAVLGLSGCERPPVEIEQIGFRGTGTQNPENPRLREQERPRHTAPAVSAPAPDVGPRAGDVYENVHVLGDLSIPEFQRTMRAITEWVAPEQGCNYCHVPGNFADENIYTKAVSRRMLEMTRHINAQWQTHVADTGVTCYTCHRGENVPAEQWFHESDPTPLMAGVGNRMYQNKPTAGVAYSSLPRNAMAAYLEGDAEIRFQAGDALPTDHVASIQHGEITYSLMMHMSDALGASCQVCHNSRAFWSWEQSPPQRTTAWHGVRMVREANNAFINSITSVFPEHRLGPMGDAGKINCATCHQGVQLPLYGAQMAQGYARGMIGGADDNLLERRWPLPGEEPAQSASPVSEAVNDGDVADNAAAADGDADALVTLLTERVRAYLD
jgi:photosynthetic reaction center cytochrome c subunit